MPRQDGTGPLGNGRPGRGLGPCGKFGTPVGGGFGRGRGMGFRQRRCWWDFAGFLRPRANQDMYPYTKDDLQAQKDELEKQIKWVNDRIADTEK